MRKILFSGAFALAALSLGACVAISGATGGAHLSHQTAAALNGMSSDVASITDVRQGAMTSSWTATLVDGRRFHCEANDMGENARCRQVS